MNSALNWARKAFLYAFGLDKIRKPSLSDAIGPLIFLVVSVVIFVSLWMFDYLGLSLLVSLLGVSAFSSVLMLIGLGPEAGWRYFAWVMGFSFLWHMIYPPFLPVLS